MDSQTADIPDKLFPPHLSLPETEASQTVRTYGLLRTRSPPVELRRGSCCSWEWWWPQSWGSAVAWGRTHSGSSCCVKGWSPGHQWVLLLLYPYIGHSPFSTVCGVERERHRDGMNVGEIIAQKRSPLGKSSFSVPLFQSFLWELKSHLKNLSIRLKLKMILYTLLIKQRNIMWQSCMC